MTELKSDQTDFRNTLKKAKKMSPTILIDDCGDIADELLGKIRTQQDFAMFFSFIANKYMYFGDVQNEDIDRLFDALSGNIEDYKIEYDKMEKKGKSVWSVVATALFSSIYYE